jgi:hypothetical protein
MVTPFKFGKRKNKDAGEASSSPSSKHNNGNNINSNNNNDSPQTSLTSNGSKSAYNYSPQQALPSQHQQQPQYHQAQMPLGFDHNNNIYNQKSPQRQQQRGYGSPQPLQHQQGPARYSDNAQRSPWSRSKLLISPFPRYRHGASQYANDKGEIFVMGGLHNTSVYGDTWIIKADGEGSNFQTHQVDIYDNSPTPRVGHASTVCGNAFVVFGGDTVTNDEGEIDNDLYLFNMNSHTWTIPHPVGKRPSGRYGHTIGVIAIMNYDSKLYLYGGQLDDMIYNDLIIFNLSSFRRPDVQWEWVIPADSIRPPPLTNHTMDVYDNKLWLFGGSTGSKLLNELWVYDPLKNKWDKPKAFGTPPPPIEEHASLVYKDCLIVHGGKDINGDAMSDVFFLNFITKTWFKMPSNYPMHPQGKYGHSLSVVRGDKLLILGGHVPDYARLGDNLEPSLEDNGVGTLLNILDLSNLEKFVPGLQQYSTPGNISAQDKFTGPQSIFTPPPAKDHTQSPEKNMYSYPAQSRLPEYQEGNIDATVVETSIPAAGTAFRAVSGSKSDPIRTVSAEDVFRKEREMLAKTPERKQSNICHRSVSGEDEQELPLEIPAPLGESSTEIPAPITKSSSKEHVVETLTDTLPGDLVAVPGVSEPVVDEFRTATASTDVLNTERESYLTDTYQNRDNARSSDILDSYASESPTRAPSVTENKAVSKTAVSSILSSGTAGITTGATAFGAAVGAAIGIKSIGNDHSSTKQSQVMSTANEDVAFSSPKTTVGDSSSSDKQQFKAIIDSLSKELEGLKVSTSEQIKAASEKVLSLEAENSELKTKLETLSVIEDKEESEDSFKRKFIKLNTDYRILDDENEQLKSKSTEMESVFTQNLIDLEKFNKIIREQQEQIESQRVELTELKNVSQEYEELRVRLETVEKEKAGLEDARSKTLDESHDEIKKLNEGIDTFLSQHLIKDESTGEYIAKSIGARTSQTGDVASGLRSQIDELLKENEEIHASSKRLYSELENAKSAATEVESLRQKVAELSKIEENYKESLHSVSTANRALQIAQSDLNKEKEVNSKLQHELDDLRLFRSKKSSRNATPIINEFDPNGIKQDDEDEEDVANAHFNLKIRDLQAEVYIIKKDRDDLKEEVMSLKKKLYNADNPSGSF